MFNCPGDDLWDRIDTDPDLRLLDEEPEFWVNTVTKEVSLKLVPRI